MYRIGTLLKGAPGTLKDKGGLPVNLNRIPGLPGGGIAVEDIWISSSHTWMQQ